MKILVIPNFDKENTITCTQQVYVKLRALGADILFDRAVQGKLDFSHANYDDRQTQIDKADLIIAIGGDGTIIHTAKDAIGKPILGINAGRLGFLANLEMKELDQLDRLVTGDYQVQKRMMLEVVAEDDKQSHRFLAVNDAVVAKGALSQMIDMEVSCNGMPMMAYRADGIIFSTPTGSTAYTLSAGGPIVDCALDALVMTPIAPHSLFDRSILFAPEHVLQLRADTVKDAEVYLTVDGEAGVRLTEKTRITVQKATQNLQLIDLNGKSFYEVLNKKFSTRLYNGDQE